METIDVSPALRERLGPEATVGLLDLLSETKKEWTAEVIDAAGDRFERRLVEETSKVRVDMAGGFSALRQEMTKEFAAVRQEMATGLSAVRQEMATGLSAVRQEMATGFATLRQEMADQRFELLKWAFLFWVGQLFALASLIAILVRALRPDG